MIENRKQGRAKMGVMFPRVTVFALLLPLLAACVEYRETLTIERDGGGIATLEVGIGETLARALDLAAPDTLDRERVVAAVDAVDGLRVTHSTLDSRDGERWLRVEVRFDTVEDLARLDTLEGFQGLFGAVALSPVGDHELRLIRQPDIDRARAGALARIPGLLAPTLSNYRWRFTAHVPTRIASARGPRAILADSRRTVSWALTLDEVLARSPSLEVDYARPGPGALGLAAGALLMLAGAGLALALVRRRRAHSAAATPR